MPDSSPYLARPAGAGYRFLSVGECMVEMAPAETAGTYRMGFAGDTFNTAWHLRQLRPDVNTAYFSRVGQDAVSQSMLAMMAGAGVDTGYVGRSLDRSVGLYLITLDAGERSFTYWRDTSAARQLADDPDLLARALADTDVAYFSGITLAILDPGARAVLVAAMTGARAAGKVVVFDPNLRPGLWRDTGEMCRAITAAAAACDIVLPSYEDEADHFGDEGPEATARRYLDAGARTVVVKNGSGPVAWVHDGTWGWVTPPPVARVVDTTAAGDSFNAGFLAGLDAAVSPEALILRAARVAGQVIGQKGALVPVTAGAGA